MRNHQRFTTVSFTLRVKNAFSSKSIGFWIGHTIVSLWLLAMLCLTGMPSVSQSIRTLQTPAEQPLHYAVSIHAPDPTSGAANGNPQLHVTIKVTRTAQAPIDFAIPAWTPGYYQILHYENDIHNVSAQEATGRFLTVSHPSERVWRVESTALSSSPSSPATAAAPALRTFITLSYDVNAHDEGLGFFGTSLDLHNQHGYINGASALMYPVGHTQAPCTLSLDVPTGWQIATPMEPASPNLIEPGSLSLGNTGASRKESNTNSPSPNDSGAPNKGVSANSPSPSEERAARRGVGVRFQAATYDEMIDCPLQLGKFDTLDFQESGVDFQCVVVGRQTSVSEGVRNSLQRITHAAIAVFGSAPFTRYRFIYHIGGGGFYGGLEHHNSTVIHLGTGLGSGANEDFLSVSAHEFFHAWNVKRLHPAALGPFDYAQPVRTSALWFAEGVTDYYAQLLLVRSGLKTRDWFWRDMLRRIEQLDHTPARVRVPLRDASTHAWEGGSEGFDGLSYYLKGSLVGLYFDLRLRALTHNRAGLDDVMRRLDAAYGSQNLPYPEDALAAAISAVAHQDLQMEYARLINSVEEIDWNPVLQSAGLQLQRDTAPFLGVRLAEEQGNGQPGALIETVEAGHAAARMGLRAGDRLLSVEGKSVSLANFSAVVHSLTPLGPVSLLVQRRGETFPLDGKVGTVYEHHRLMPLPVGQMSPAQQAEARELQTTLFAPPDPIRRSAQATAPDRGEK